MDPPSGSISQDKMYQDKRVFMTFPPFHVSYNTSRLISRPVEDSNSVLISSQGAYLFSHFFNAVPFDTVMIAPTSGGISTAQGLVDGLKKTAVDTALIVPLIVQELNQSPKHLDFCAKNLEMIMYCGGDLP